VGLGPWAIAEVGAGVAVSPGDGVLEGEGVSVAIGVGVLVDPGGGVLVGVGVGVLLGVGVLVGVVGVLVTILVGVGVGEVVIILVGVGVGELVGVLQSQSNCSGLVNPSEQVYVLAS